MKRWSVSMIFEKYVYNYSGSTMVLQKTTTNLAVRHVNAKTEEEAFGIAYFDALRTIKGHVLFSHNIVEILPIKRKTKKTEEDAK